MFVLRGDNPPRGAGGSNLFSRR